MFIIKTKNEGYTGEISGIPFLNGVEETEKVEENTVEETSSEESGKTKKGR